MSNQKNRVNIIFLLLLSLFGCNREQKNKMTIDQVQNVFLNHFSLEELEEVETAFLNQIDLYMTYNLPSVHQLMVTEWEVLYPICIDSMKQRAIITIGVKLKGTLSNTVDVQVWAGMNLNGKWYFRYNTYHPHLMEEPDGKRVDKYTFELINQISVDRYLFWSIVYNEEDSIWGIRESFFDNLMERTKMLTEDGERFYHHCSKVEYRSVEIVKEARQEEDLLRQQGEINDKRWKEILRIRDPKAREDWKLVDDFNKRLDKDSTIVRWRKEWREFKKHKFG